MICNFGSLIKYLIGLDQDLDILLFINNYLIFKFSNNITLKRDPCNTDPVFI